MMKGRRETLRARQAAPRRQLLLALGGAGAERSGSGVPSKGGRSPAVGGVGRARAVARLAIACVRKRARFLLFSSRAPAWSQEGGGARRRARVAQWYPPEMRTRRSSSAARGWGDEQRRERGPPPPARLLAGAALGACGAAPGSERWHRALHEAFALEASAGGRLEGDAAVEVLGRIAGATRQVRNKPLLQPHLGFGVATTACPLQVKSYALKPAVQP